jgi:drug/metabolite transporter (DMT)-like permease
LFVLLWSTGFIGAKYGLPYAEPLTFLSLRMATASALFAILIVAMRAPWPSWQGVGHSIVVGLLVHGLYQAGVFLAIHWGMPAGLSAVIPGLQPVLTSTLANRLLGEQVGKVQWIGLALGLVGVALIVSGRTSLVDATAAGWIAVTLSLLGITAGTLYQKHFCRDVDLRSGIMIQYLGAGAMFFAGSCLFETRAIDWNVHFVFAVGWLAVVLSTGAILLLYMLLRRAAATRVASLFYLVPAVTALMAFALFGERLDVLQIAGMIVCAAAVFIVNRRGAA